MTDRQIKTTDIVLVGIFAAILAIISQISIPTPFGIPITLQTFAVALCGYFLGYVKGFASVLVYILLGAVGVPVWANFSGGLQVLLGATGGYIFGFLLMVVLCGIPVKNKPLRIALGCVGLLLCHLCGVIQFSIVMSKDLFTSFCLASLPYLIKDVISVAAAYFAALAIIKAVHIKTA